MLLSLLVAAVVAQPPACQAVHSDHIYAGDLAAMIPAFRNLPADQSMGLSPIPGQRRVFRSFDIVRIARANHLDANFEGDVCFEWTRSAPDAKQVLAAMTAALQPSHATVEIVELPANPIPAGEISFPLTGISGYSDGPVVWRGFVKYAPNRSLPLWARVRLTAHERRIVASDMLRPGSPVTSRNIRVEDYAGPFQYEKKFSDPQQVIGLTPCSTIAAGTVLTSAMLREAIAVERGDTVQVLVQFNGARIEAQGVAEQNGPVGSVITVRNTKSGRTFRARVEDRDRVLVLPTSAAGLVVEEPKS